jgi:phosphoribosylamine--glycine ligase
MNVIVIGSGGREHCLVWKIAQSPHVEKVYCAGGNAGITQLAEIIPPPVGPDFFELVNFAKENDIGLTVVGPENPLAEGIVDIFNGEGLAIFGPTQQTAQIESSKVFAKELMLEAGVPTGMAEIFSSSREAVAYLKSLKPPYVVKADGLAAGKGVTICHSFDEAKARVEANLEQRMFGDASRKILVEEFLSGEEASLLAFTDGDKVVPMVPSQDHKPVFDGDTGPNTGGMGAYSPTPLITPALNSQIIQSVLVPTVRELRKRGMKYQGVLYAGVIITDDGPKVLEFNCRFGDPETQAILPRLQSDLVEVLLATVEERLYEVALEWYPDSAVCVIAASGGYPGSYEKGKPIHGLEQIPQDGRTFVFHAGTRRENSGIVTDGGRVLGLTTLAPTLREAIQRNYELLRTIHFDKMHYRTDIGHKALKRLGEL